MHVNVHRLGDLEQEVLAIGRARSDGPVLVQERVLEDRLLVRQSVGAEDPDTRTCQVER